ncbi:hypothetical protein ZWY2020_027944 [Hordeum vulgare]|nr:hypothetical protein ZWY2020_027944 [Hordeum vulgare]
MAHAGGSSSGGGSAPESNWPLSLDTLATEELYRYGLLVPRGCRLAKPWWINKDGDATQGDPVTAEEHRTHRGERYNIRGRHAFWDGKNYNAVIAQLRTRSRAAVPQPPPAVPPVPPEFDLPPEQVVLREDGDPDDSPGLLVALRASQATTGPSRQRRRRGRRWRSRRRSRRRRHWRRRTRSPSLATTTTTTSTRIVIERLKKEVLIYKPSFKDINPEENGVDESEVWVKRKYASKYFREVDSSPLGECEEEKNDASFTNMPIDEELNDDTGARMNESGIGTPNDPFIANGNISLVRSSS